MYYIYERDSDRSSEKDIVTEIRDGGILMVCIADTVKSFVKANSSEYT